MGNSIEIPKAIQEEILMKVGFSYEWCGLLYVDKDSYSWPLHIGVILSGRHKGTRVANTVVYDRRECVQRRPNHTA